MKIVTHPDNREYLDEIHKEVSRQNEPFGVIPISQFGFDIVFDDMIPAEVPSKTEFVALQHKFCEYNIEKPAAWEIFCGYVRPKMVPNFIMVDDRKYTIMRNGSPEVHLWR
jgi:hypothetical protein